MNKIWNWEWFKWKKTAGESLASTVFGSATTKKQVQIESSEQYEYAPQTTWTYSPTTTETITYSPVVQIESAGAKAQPTVTPTVTPQISVIPTLIPQQTTEQKQEATQKDIITDSSGFLMLILLGVGAYFVYKLLV